MMSRLCGTRGSHRVFGKLNFFAKHHQSFTMFPDLSATMIASSLCLFPAVFGCWFSKLELPK